MAKTQRKPTESFKRSIGGLLKAKRLEMGFTLQELAERAELSAAFLSQAERGKATPSIISLINIAGALDTDINYFVTPPEPMSLVRRANDPRYIDIDSPVVYKRLDAQLRNQKMSGLLMEIPPGTGLPAVHRREGEDFFYVISGQVEYGLGDEVFVLKKGDAAHHNTQIDHTVINKSSKVAKLLWVGTPVLFPSSLDAKKDT